MTKISSFYSIILDKFQDYFVFQSLLELVE